MVTITETPKLDDEKKNTTLTFIKVNVNSKLVWGSVVMNLAGLVRANYTACRKVSFLSAQRIKSPIVQVSWS